MNLPAQLPRPDQIWSIVDCFAFFDMADDAMRRPYNAANHFEVSERIVELSQLFPSAGDVQAAAVYYANEAFRVAVHDYAQELKDRAEQKDIYKPLVAPMVLSAYLKSRTAEYLHMKEKAERCSAGLVHSLDALRSVLSNLKEHARLATFGGGGA